MFGKKTKKEPAKTTDPQVKRYYYDFCIVPSIFAHAFMQMFVPDDEKPGPMRKAGLEAKDFEEYERIENGSAVKVLDTKEGQIAVLSFPECDYSPSVIYGIGVYKSADFEASEKAKREYSAPYYVLAKILDHYVIGEILADKAKGLSYFVKYYDQQSTPDLLQFLRWVMEKENLNPEDKWNELFKEEK